MNEYYMNIAIKEATKAYKYEEVPVGAVIVKKNNKPKINIAFNNTLLINATASIAVQILTLPTLRSTAKYTSAIAQKMKHGATTRK